MPDYRYRLVDVFTATPFRGNPLAVFPDAAGIDPALMQQIAAELNLSETTFVLPSNQPECDVRVRIFTPTTEMPMAGHPTIGTAFVLDRGQCVTFEEGVGPIRVERVAAPSGGSMWRMTQPLPRWGAPAQKSEVAAALGLEVADLLPELPSEVVSCGMPFLMVPLRDLAALARVEPRSDLWRRLGHEIDAAGVYCFTLAAGEQGVGARSRMFAPEYGVTEDPATGSASGPLGCYLVRHGVAPAGKLLNVQGVEMGRRSEIHVEIEGTAKEIAAVHVGGECVHVGEGRLEHVGP